MRIPTAHDVELASSRIRPLARHTPLLQHPELNARSGAKIWLKPESLQVTGSFKIRGASNRIAQIPVEARSKGVVAFSSGNHAQGVSRAAKYYGCPATIVMPDDAPSVKIDGVRADGAEIVFYKRGVEAREPIADALAAEHGAVLIPSFDDPDIVAGQGTVGLEVAADLADMGEPLDHMICCTGGGGLVTGSALAMRNVFPKAAFWTAEPVGYDDWARSLAAGEIEANNSEATSFCDAILTPAPGRVPFEIAKTHLTGGFAVSDDEVAEAMRFAFRYLKLVLEPGGAVALAVALRGLPPDMVGRSVVIVASGGNVDAALFADVLQGASPPAQ